MSQPKSLRFKIVVLFSSPHIQKLRSNWFEIFQNENKILNKSQMIFDEFRVNLISINQIQYDIKNGQLYLIWRGSYITFSY